MAEGATSRVFEGLSWHFLRQVIWVKVTLDQRGEYVRTTLDFHHDFVVNICDPFMSCIGGIFAIGGGWPTNLFALERWWGGHA